jgi:hypothetical protein
MSQHPVFQSGGSGTIIFLVLLALGSATFGYVVGRNDKDSYLQKKSQHIEQKQPNLDTERR